MDPAHVQPLVGLYHGNGCLHELLCLGAGKANRHGPQRLCKGLSPPVEQVPQLYDAQTLEQRGRSSRPTRLGVCPLDERRVHPEVSDDWRREEFGWFAQCPDLIFQVLTKRPAYAYSYYLEHPFDGNNIWLGTSVGGQKDLKMVYDIVKTPAKLHWVSYEPALTPLHVDQLPSKIRWLVIGGESTQGIAARPFHIEWAREAIKDCQALGIAVFMKQLGSNAYLDGQRYKTKDSHGADPSEWLDDLRVREIPQ